MKMKDFNEYLDDGIKKLNNEFPKNELWLINVTDFQERLVDFRWVYNQDNVIFDTDLNVQFRIFDFVIFSYELLYDLLYSQLKKDESFFNIDRKTHIKIIYFFKICLNDLLAAKLLFNNAHETQGLSQIRDFYEHINILILSIYDSDFQSDFFNNENNYNEKNEKNI